MDKTEFLTRLKEKQQKNFAISQSGYIRTTTDPCWRQCPIVFLAFQNTGEIKLVTEAAAVLGLPEDLTKKLMLATDNLAGDEETKQLRQELLIALDLTEPQPSA